MVTGERDPQPSPTLWLTGRQRRTGMRHHAREIVEEKELLAENLPDPRFAIEQMFPEGVTVLAGKAKSAKSWLILEAALCVCDGRPFLEQFRTDPGAVLYLGLEDSKRRMQDRILKLRKATGTIDQAGYNLDVHVKWPQADQGGMQELEEWLEYKPEARMVVIDNMREFDAVGYAYKKDSTKIARLSELGEKYHVAIVVVMHMYKGPAISSATPDWKDKIQGSVGVTGAADVIMGLGRDQGDALGTLRVTGKDVPEQTLPLSWDKESGLWTPAGEHATVEQQAEMNDRQKQLFAVVEANGGQSASQIGRVMGIDFRVATAALKRMRATGKLDLIERCWYTPEQVARMHEEPTDQLKFGEFTSLAAQKPTLDVVKVDQVGAGLVAETSVTPGTDPRLKRTNGARKSNGSNGSNGRRNGTRA